MNDWLVRLNLFTASSFKVIFDPPAILIGGAVDSLRVQERRFFLFHYGY